LALTHREHVNNILLKFNLSIYSAKCIEFEVMGTREEVREDLAVRS
jgi:hypothetical protein